MCFGGDAFGGERLVSRQEARHSGSVRAQISRIDTSVGACGVRRIITPNRSRTTLSGATHCTHPFTLHRFGLGFGQRVYALSLSHRRASVGRERTKIELRVAGESTS